MYNQAGTFQALFNCRWDNFSGGLKTVKKIHLKIEDNPFRPFATLHTQEPLKETEVDDVGGSGSSYLELLLRDTVVSVSSQCLAADVVDRLEFGREKETSGTEQLELILWYPAKKTR